MAPTEDVETEVALFTFKGQLMKTLIPEDSQQHMLSIIIEPEGIDIYMDGVPIDPDTGMPGETLVVTDELLQACDEMAKAFRDGGWKISTAAKAIFEQLDKYEKLRKELKPVAVTPPEVESAPNPTV